MTEILKSPSFPNGLPPARSEDEVRASRATRSFEVGGELVRALRMASEAMRDVAHDATGHLLTEAADAIEQSLAREAKMLEALEKISKESREEGGCYYTNRANIDRARAALKAINGSGS